MSSCDLPAYWGARWSLRDTTLSTCDTTLASAASCSLYLTDSADSALYYQNMCTDGTLSVETKQRASEHKDTVNIVYLAVLIPVLIVIPLLIAVRREQHGRVCLGWPQACVSGMC